MDKSELLSEFKAQLASFDKYQTFIDKARSYAERFNPAVVEKVISDNTEKIEEVAAALNPLVDDMQAVIAGIKEDREGVLGGVEQARLAVEELELRQMIGEIDDESFEKETGDLKGQIAQADDRVAELDLELEDFTSALDSWLERRPDVADFLDDEPEPAFDDEEEEEEQEDELDDVIESGDEPEDDLLGDYEEEEGVALEDDDHGDDDLLGFEDAEDPGAAGIHSERVQMSDDVSAVFDETVEEPIEAGDADGIAFAPNEIADLGEDLFSEPKGGASASADADGGGQAVLILGEGTAEEHVYPVTGEVLSLGRGRDNNVQVKNDSKVSRYHCKLVRRDGHFFIADNKSANGTLVDGELITEKRLVGGEEVIIGETFFRFRIQH